MNLISKHFTVDEFRCHDGTPYPAEWVGDRLNSLCSSLDPLRDAWGAPLVVVSGYRTAGYNARLASASSSVARNSQHIQGRAADVRPMVPTVAAVKQLHALAKEMHAAGKLPRMGGLGYYEGLWIHVDTRSHAPGALVEWVGAGVGSEK